jgi:cobalt-precorrin 5A hydrolase
MKISLISFTLNGADLGHLLSKFLNEQGNDAKAYAIGGYAKGLAMQSINEPLKDWTKKQFHEVSAIIFIGATGIAVRTISPFLKDKTTDPAVLVIDEKGKFVIPLLSGHIGGANELAYNIASHLGTIPVITTATDLNQKFAVDLFAKKNNLYISRLDYAKAISAALLNDNQVSFESEFPVVGELPEDLTNKKDCEYGICITLHDEKEVYHKTLKLIPRILTLGIGCRKGKSLLEIETVVSEVLKECKISIYTIANVASIDLKKEEKGILEFCDKLKVKLVTYSAEELEKVQGVYSESDYVKSVTGVGNVCERAAILGSGNGILIQKKYAQNGVTVSIAKKDWSVRF